KHPPFANLDHARVVREATAVYENEAGVKAAVLKHPQFAGLDHARVVRERVRLGAYVGLSRKESIDLLLKNPVFAGYSAKRYLAGMDIARTLHTEGFLLDEIMHNAYFSNISKSPYVPGSKKQRVSHVQDYKEPPLMTAMRKYLERKK
ncbi:hypothetical protein HZA99_03880, partial [Candidatus Woesearchaeota archaeon]|nr:hypothetical protein [Candidatus Woesearchaeota archaeon]